jgi:hypothetical protein
VAAEQVATGPPITPIARIRLYSAEEWEAFTNEWAHSLFQGKDFVRFSGAGDKGIDIAVFDRGQTFDCIWDGYQCKHYDNALRPSDIYVELGKVLWFSSRFLHRPMTTSVSSCCGSIPPVMTNVRPRKIGFAQFLRVAIDEAEIPRRRQQGCERDQPEGWRREARAPDVTDYLKIPKRVRIELRKHQKSIRGLSRHRAFRSAVAVALGWCRRRFRAVRYRRRASDWGGLIHRKPSRVAPHS